MLTYYKNSKIYQHVPIFKLLFALWLMSVIVLAGGCSDDSSFTVLKAKIISPGNDIEIKEGEAVFLKGLATGGVPPYSYFWYFEKGAPDSESQNTGEVFFNYEGAYTASLTVIDRSGAKDSSFIRIIVSQK